MGTTKQTTIPNCAISYLLVFVPDINESFSLFRKCIVFITKKILFVKPVWFYYTKFEQGLSGQWKRGWAVFQRGVPSTKKTRKKAHRENNVEGIKICKGHLIYQSWCY